VIANSQKGAFYSGIVAFLLTVGSVAWLVRRKLVSLSAMAPYLGITLYVLLSASVTGFARLGFGGPQALSSRYVTIASPFWAVFITVALLLVTLVRRTQPARVGSFVMGACALLLFSRLAVNSFWDGSASFRARHDQMLAAREGLVRGEDSEPVRALYPDYAMIESHLPALRERRLSCFRDAAALPGRTEAP